MIKWCIRKLMPDRIAGALWGDRKKWGLIVQKDDPCWREWGGTYLAFYNQNQRKGVGVRVNDASYRIMSSIDLSDKVLLEIGPGDIRHIPFWIGKKKPKEYIVADVQMEILHMAKATLSKAGLPVKTLLVNRESTALPLESGSVDVIISFYSLEHIYPLAPYLRELSRILRPGGWLVGAIPAEGGLAWGLGRALTSRRWLKRNTTIDPDKIICWEHPNYADDILRDMDAVFKRRSVSLWPLPFLPLLDTNLIIKFLYEKEASSK